MDTNIASVTGNVRSRRLAARLTQIELAECAGCGWSTIRLFDRGYVPAHSDALERVLAVLDEAELEREAAGMGAA